ncbi:Trafficking protein particle complex subunit BET5 [Malassezia obtusa]|uniref:Trafficking protein particle complex subunit n=1 Tax=Malassezia obtusa TaxID=76774 RepID=A0AAF0IXY4_9BASI|nr:Trafficking protein particle complex subunit BET5 [Malassezia obtusa]
MQVYSLWIFDRHCDAIYHQDWSHVHQQGTASSFTSSLGATFQRVGGPSDGAKPDAAAPLRPAGDALPGVSRNVTQEPTDSGLLPFDQEAKLIYGLVFSLRNLVRKLGGKQEQFYNFSTSTYTLSHLQTPSMYTFVMITDPPPGRNAKGPLANFASTSAIPGTAGMTLRGVLHEIWRGPWVQHAAHHPLVNCTEREAYMPPLPPPKASEPEAPTPPATRAELGERIQRTHGIDNDALRAAIEKILVQYRLLPM